MPKPPFRGWWPNSKPTERILTPCDVRNSTGVRALPAEKRSPYIHGSNVISADLVIAHQDFSCSCHDIPRFINF